LSSIFQTAQSGNLDGVAPSKTTTGAFNFFNARGLRATKGAWLVNCQQRNGHAANSHLRIALRAARLPPGRRRGEAPPAVRRSDDEVLEFVRKTPGAVGYVSAGASLQGVKAVSVR